VGGVARSRVAGQRARAQASRQAYPRGSEPAGIRCRRAAALECRVLDGRRPGVGWWRDLEKWTIGGER
jgi:hypothetical protein